MSPSGASRTTPDAGPADAVVDAVGDGDVRSVYLVHGDLVVAEPQARRIADALAERAGCAVEVHRRPAGLDRIFADLQTFSLFDSAKVSLVVDAALLADSRAAADLVDQAAEALPFDRSEDGKDLDGKAREAASRLIQALRVFGIEPDAGSAESRLEALPDWAFRGGAALRKKKPRGRSKKQAARLRDDLVDLLDAGLESGLRGVAEGDLAELAKMADGGLPEGHALVLAERSAAADHPLVETLESRGALLEVATVTADKKGNFHGLGDLVAQLEAETGAGIARDAVDALARRTLNQSDDWKSKSVQAESTGRFAGEYRKLANLADGSRITRRMVERTVKDRGDEDVWKILDAIAEGRGAEAVARYRRHVESKSDPVGTRLRFFGLLAGFCRQLSAIAGMARAAKVPPGVRSYNTFKSRWAPALQGGTPDGAPNPLKGLHPYRLHRAYLAASQIDRDELGRLPSRVLDTEMQLKGEASDADTAMIALIGHLVASRL